MTVAAGGSTECDSYAYFCVTSDLPLAAIVSHLGHEGEPRSWSVGDLHRGGRVYTFSNWKLQSGVEKGRPLDEHLRALWRRMEPLYEAVRTLPPEMKGWLVCTARFAARGTPLTLSAGHFETAATYGLELDFDFYFEEEFVDDEVGRARWYRSSGPA